MKLIKICGQSLALVTLLGVFLLVLGAQGDAGERVPCSGNLIVFEGQASIEEATGDCLVVAYQYRDGAAPGANFPDTLPQAYQWQSTTGGTVPDCAYQIDLVQGNAKVAKPTMDSQRWYSGQGALVDSIHGGTRACVAAPPTQPPVPPTPPAVPAIPSPKPAVVPTPAASSISTSPPAVAVPAQPKTTG